MTGVAVRAKRLIVNSVETGRDCGPYVGLEHVESHTGRLVPGWTGAGDPDGAISFRRGDVLFGKLRPYLAKTWAADRAGRCSGEFLVLRVGRRIEAAFLAYVTQAEPWLDWAQLTSYGTKMPRTSWSSMGELALTLPTLDVQRETVAFLDRETAKIDALIAKQNALLAALEEHREAVVASASPKSLAMVGWPLDKLGRRTRIGNGSTPSRQNLAYWDGGSTPWMNSSVVNQPVVDAASDFVTDLAMDECHLPLVKAGGLLVGLTGQGKTRGMATITELPTTISQHLAFVEPSEVHWSPRFLLWQLRASYAELRRVSDENGSTKGGLTCGDLASLQVAMPPLERQRSTTEEIDRETGTIDAVARKARVLMNLLRERRAALITAAVTGKLDVATYGQAG